MLQTDSTEYYITINAIKYIANNDKLILCIGVRAAGEVAYILNTLNENHNKNKTVIMLDPYGGLEYKESNDRIVTITDYTNIMRHTMLIDIYTFLGNSNVANLLYFPLEDIEFQKRFASGIPIYENGQKSIENRYCFTSFDGPHDDKSVISEFKFFNRRTNIGATCVFDDCETYGHSKIEEEYIIPTGWEILEKGTRKISYIKVK